MEEYTTAYILKDIQERLKSLETHIKESSKDKGADKAKLSFYKNFAQFQAHMPHIKSDNKNTHFKSKYTTLAGLQTTVFPVLTQFGFSVMQSPLFKEDKTILVTTLFHEDGHTESSTLELRPKNPHNEQEVVKYNTYMKRVALSSMLGLSTHADDDDGESSAQYSRPLTKQQVDILNKAVGDNKDLKDKILSYYKVYTINDLKQGHFKAIMDRIK